VCGSRKYRCPPQGGFLEIPRGRGISKAKLFFKESIKPNWNFQREEGSNKKTLHGRSMDIFWTNTITNQPTTFHMIKWLGVIIILLLCP